MRILTICLRVAAMLCGVALIVSQVLFNLEGMGGFQPTSGLAVSAVAVPLAMAIAAVIMGHCLGERRYGMAAVTLLVLLCGIGHTAVVALERSAYNRDRIVAAKRGENAAYQLALKAHQDALARVRELEALVQPSCKVAHSDRCKGVMSTLEGARSWALERQVDLAQAGAPVEAESMAKRYGAAAAYLDVWHPILLPMAMELGGIVLVAFALRRRKAEAKSLVLSTLPTVSKEDEAVMKLEALRRERGGRLPSVRETARLTGIPPTTVFRAKSRLRGAA